MLAFFTIQRRITVTSYFASIRWALMGFLALIIVDSAFDSLVVGFAYLFLIWILSSIKYNNAGTQIGMYMIIFGLGFVFVSCGGFNFTAFAFGIILIIIPLLFFAMDLLLENQGQSRSFCKPFFTL